MELVRERGSCRFLHSFLGGNVRLKPDLRSSGMFPPFDIHLSCLFRDAGRKFISSFLDSDLLFW